MKNKSAETKNENKKDTHESNIRTRGRTFTGTVMSDKMAKTVTVAWTSKAFVKKYERYERKRSKVKAHNPDSIGAKKGDVVKIVETRPLSKTKNFIVTEILGRESKVESIKNEELQEAAKIRETKLKEKESRHATAKEESEE